MDKYKRTLEDLHSQYNEVKQKLQISKKEKSLLQDQKAQLQEKIDS